MINKAVILAGGKSSRMGKDKALLPFGGYNSLAEYQYRRLKEIFDEVYISAKSDKFDFSPNIILDKSDMFSPILAIKSVLEELNDATFILGVDMPNTSKDTIFKILDSFNKKFDVIVAKCNNYFEPLCGVYTPSILNNIEKALKENNHRLNYLLKNVSVLPVNIENNLEFANINHPFEYKLLHQREFLENRD